MLFRSGTYQGLSAQFSGEGFSDMRFEVDAVPTEEFQAWVSEVRTKSGVLDGPAYAQLARPSRVKGTTTYAEVSVGLFDAIVAGSLPAASGTTSALVRH